MMQGTYLSILITGWNQLHCRTCNDKGVVSYTIIPSRNQLEVYESVIENFTHLSRIMMEQGIIP
jgi:hypothetical protein